MFHIKGRSRRLRPKAYILDDPLGNPYDVLKVLLGPPYRPYGPYKGPFCGLLKILLLESDRAIRDLCRGPRTHLVALKGLLRRHKGCPRGHLRCELWVLVGDSSL